MHHVYSTLAMDIARDRAREAAQRRLVEKARRNRPSRSVIDRLRGLLTGPDRQPLLRPAFTAETSDCS